MALNPSIKRDALNRVPYVNGGASLRAVITADKEKMKKTILATVLSLSPILASAGTLVIPGTIEHDGRTYTLAYQGKAGYTEFYEYTTNGESVEDWTSLVTLLFAPIPSEKGEMWLRSMRQVLSSRTPKPFYEAKVRNKIYFTRAVMMPSEQYPHYESNVQRGYMSTCDGFVIYQYGVKEDASKDRKEVIAENSALADYVLGSEWQPQCQ